MDFIAAIEATGCDVTLRWSALAALGLVMCCLLVLRAVARERMSVMGGQMAEE